MKMKSFECDLCQEIFTTKDNLKRHYIRKHEKIYRDENTLDEQMTCNYQDCTLEFFHEKKFLQHLAAAHKINIKSKRLSFPQWSNSFLGKKKRNSTIMLIFLNIIKSQFQTILKILTLFDRAH